MRSVLVLCVLLAACAHPPAQSEDSLAVRETVYRSPGKVIAAGSNVIPKGQRGLISYRVEETHLASTIKWKADDNSTVETERVWRVVITGGPFHPGSAPYVIWVDDKPIGVALESADLASVTTVVTDLNVLKSGAKLAISVGKDPARRFPLDEQLVISAVEGAK
jgi:hypothetical protein